MADDRELLAAWQAGDRAAGDELVRAHFAVVCRFFRSKLGDDIEDLIQQTFLDLAAAAVRTPIYSVRAALLTIARRRLLDHLRARYHRDAVELVSSLSAAEIATSPRGRVARAEEASLVGEALRRISLEHQMILELAYWEELSGPEIAEILEIREATVRTRLSRARASLLAEIREHSARSSDS